MVPEIVKSYPWARISCSWVGRSTVIVPSQMSSIVKSSTTLFSSSRIWIEKTRISLQSGQFSGTFQFDWAHLSMDTFLWSFLEHIFGDLWKYGSQNLFSIVEPMLAELNHYPFVRHTAAPDPKLFFTISLYPLWLTAWKCNWKFTVY